MKTRYFVLIIFFSILIYLALFPNELDPEFTISPAWNVSLLSPPTLDGEQEFYSFSADDLYGNPLVGYYSLHGDLLYRSPVYFGAAANSEGFINYSKAGGALLVQDPLGEFTERIDTPGYPVFFDQQLYVMTGDRKGLSRWTMEGGLIWKYHFGSMITSISVQDRGGLLGFLNGEVRIFDNQGRLRDFTRQKVDAVYGCALAPTQDLFAVVTGLDPQVVSVYSFQAEQVQFIWSRELSESIPRYRYLEFSQDSRELFWVTPEGLESVDWMGEDHQFYPVDFPFSKGIFSKQYQLSFIFGSDKDASVIEIFESNGVFKMTIPVYGQMSLVDKIENRFIFDRAGQLFAVDLLGE